jgi:hypothetical protein
MSEVKPAPRSSPISRYFAVRAKRMMRKMLARMAARQRNANRIAGHMGWGWGEWLRSYPETPQTKRPRPAVAAMPMARPRRMRKVRRRILGPEGWAGEVQ